MRKHFAGDVCGDLNRDRRARTEGWKRSADSAKASLRSVGDADALHRANDRTIAPHSPQPILEIYFKLRILIVLVKQIVG